MRDLFFAAFHGINHLYYFAILQKNDIKNEAKENRYMGKKTQKPVINSVMVNYNGEQEKFENFICSLLKSYLDSDSLTKTDQQLSVQKVDLSEKSA